VAEPPQVRHLCPLDGESALWGLEGATVILSIVKRVRLVPGFLKRAYIRFVRFQIRHPVDQLLEPTRGEIAQLREEVAAIRSQLDLAIADSGPFAQLDQRQRSTEAMLATLELTVQDVVERIERTNQELGEAAGAISKLELDRSADEAELRMQRSRLELVLREARRALPGTLREEQRATLTKELERLLGEHYEEFEVAFRGSRESVRERQKAYLDDVLLLRALKAPVLDLGCGRGEWLELLRDHGVEAYGVDMNERFVDENRERGLDVRHEDALEHLRGLPESSVAAVTAFHLIEHLELELLLDLVDEALRALRPGGLLLFETPNPTNLDVGASTFHIDPTHRKPVHPLWLEFLLTTRGFVDVELRYLNPSREVKVPVPSVDGDDPELLRTLADAVFFGPRDYGALARKSTPAAG
jgi:SAM-dependent methyltransferase